MKAFEYRRVKNDVRDATDLADLLRMGRLAEAWIAPPATRELRELVRHRASKLVGLRSHCKAEVMRCWLSAASSVSDTGCWATICWTRCGPVQSRVGSDDLEEEIDLFTRLARGRLVADPGYVALQQLPGVGPILAAVFRSEATCPFPQRGASWRPGPV